MSRLPVECPVSGKSEDAAENCERLVVLFRDNERLIAALQTVSQRLHAVRGYVAEPDCNVGLGGAYYLYWRTRHSGVLTMLRANRLEGRRILERLGRK